MIVITLPKVERQTSNPCRVCGGWPSDGRHDPADECTGGWQGGGCRDPQVHHSYRALPWWRRIKFRRNAEW